MRLIDADNYAADIEKQQEEIMELLDTVDDNIVVGTEPDRWVGVLITLERAKELLLEQSTIDAVPVIRCKDCKYNNDTILNHGKNHPRCCFTDYVLTENDFCSRGEKR